METPPLDEPLPTAVADCEKEPLATESACTGDEAEVAEGSGRDPTVGDCAGELDATEPGLCDMPWERECQTGCTPSMLCGSFATAGETL